MEANGFPIQCPIKNQKVWGETLLEEIIPLAMEKYELKIEMKQYKEPFFSVWTTKNLMRGKKSITL